MYNFKRIKSSLMLLDLGTPLNMSFFWNFGSLLGLFCGIQIFTGLFLSMYYNKSIELAFFSVKLSIQNEVFLGWLFHNFHSTGASFFFILLYLHLFRGIYYGGFNQLKIWLSGVSMLILSMAMAFLGYVLPWGQMSFWGATVMTNLFSAVPYLGKNIVILLWGGYGVAGPTLNRFFSFHFVVPFMMLFLAFLHVFIFLHVKGSSNPLGGSLQQYFKLEFFPYFMIKDLLGIFFMIFIFLIFSILFPRLLLDSENFINAKSLVTPVHIQPEWYFLSSYAILRSIPNKFGGVLALVISILVFYFFPLFFQNLLKNSFFSKKKFKSMLWLWSCMVIILCFMGASSVEFPWVKMGSVCSFFYFIFMIFIFF